MIKIKKLLETEWTQIRQLPWPTIDTVLKYLALSLLLFQFVRMAGMLYELKESQGYMYVRGDDAASAIKTATQTRWWNTNGWYPYGPVYYRITHTIASLVSSDTPVEISKNNHIDKTHHFALTLVSLASLFGICYFVSWILLSSLSLRLIGTAALVSSFVHNNLYSKYIFTAHPDFLFAFLLSLSLYATYRLIREPENFKEFIFAAVFWGIAASTKMIFVYFLPMTLFIWRPALNRLYFKKIIRFYAYMFLAYLLVGFPQNLLVHEVVNFMLFMSKFNRPIDLEFLQYWVSLIWSQLSIPLLCILLLSIIPNDEDQNPVDSRAATKILVLCFIPILMMFSRKMINSNEHYPLPFVVAFLTCLGLFIRSQKAKFSFKYTTLTKLSSFLVLLLATHFGFKFIPATYYQQRDKQLNCHKENKKIYQIISEKLEKQGKAFLDPYVPYNLNLSDRVIRSYKHDLESFEKERPSLVVITNYMYRFFGEVSPYVKTDLEDWPKIKQYYEIFKEKDQAFDPQKNLWQRIYNDKVCRFQVYEKIKK